MKLRALWIFALLLVMNVPANAVKSEWVTREEAYVTSYYMDKNLTGFVKIRKCKTCKEELFKITPKIKAFLSNKEVPLSGFVGSKNKPRSLVFERATGKFVALNWLRKR